MLQTRNLTIHYKIKIKFDEKDTYNIYKVEHLIIISDEVAITMLSNVTLGLFVLAF